MSQSYFDTRFGIVPRLLIKTRAYQQFEFVPGEVKFLTGFRGSGKTVLLNYLYHHLPANWVGAYTTNSKQLIYNINHQLYQQLGLAKMLPGFQHYVESVNFFGVGIKFQSDKLDFYSLALMTRLLEYWSKYKSVMVFVDEAAPRDELVNFLNQYSDLQQMQHPISVTITGIDRDIAELRSIGGLTYLIRAEEIRSGLLDRDAMAQQYRFALGCSVGDSYLLANTCGGYAYGFQLLGKLITQSHSRLISVDADMPKLIKSVLAEFKNQLFSKVYRAIFVDLRYNQQLALLAVNKLNCGATLSSLAQQIGMRRQNLYSYLSDLVALGLVNHPNRGSYRYALLYLGDFVKHIADPMSGAYVGSFDDDHDWRGLVHLGLE